MAIEGLSLSGEILCQRRSNERGFVWDSGAEMVELDVDRGSAVGASGHEPALATVESRYHCWLASSSIHSLSAETRLSLRSLMSLMSSPHIICSSSHAINIIINDASSGT